MDTQLLSSFLAVAQVRHFGRAAERVGLSQPALSHQIRRLEEHVGAPLFERTSRTVRLTDAGRALLPEARQLVIGLERAVAHARSTARGEGGRLAVGSIGAALNGVAPLLVGDLRARVPGVAIHVEQLDTPAGVAALRAGELDVAIVRCAGAPSGLRMERLMLEPLVALLPAAHPLACRPAVALEDLAGEEFVLWPRTASPSFHEYLLDACRAALFEPHVAMEGAGIETLLGLVSAGVGVSLQPLSFASLEREGVAWRPLAGEVPRSPVQIAWREPARTPLIGLAVELAHAATARWLRAHDLARAPALQAA